MDVTKEAERMESGAEKFKDAREMKDKAQDVGARAKSTARDAGAAADLYLHEYAWTSMVIVALIAGSVGFMLGRGRD